MNPLDWKAILLHPLSHGMQVKCDADRSDTGLVLGDVDKRELWAIADTWDLRDSTLTERLGELAETIPTADVIAADSIPSSVGLVRLPAPQVISEKNIDENLRTTMAVEGWGWTLCGITVDEGNGPHMTLALIVHQIISSSMTAPDGTTKRLMFSLERGVWPVHPDAAPMLGANTESFTLVRTSDLDLDGQIGETAAELWKRQFGTRFLLALWTLKDAGVLPSDTGSDRAAAKRCRRAGATNTNVTTIYLPHRSSGSGSGDGSGVATHWVRGHWRWQPVGAGRADRRLTWVRPHVRGSIGDAPDTPGERIVVIR